jgi:hypothetical protein
MNDEELRAAYLRLLDTRPARTACPAPEVLLATVEREGPETTRLHVLDHAAACAECLRDLELLRAVTEAGGARQRVPTSARWLAGVPLALAAAALVVALSLNSSLRDSRRQPDTPRGEASPVALLTPADGGGAAASALAFTWHRVPVARRYTLEVVTTDGAVALRSETADTTVTAAGALRAGEYRWWVRAQTEDGAERRSATRLLRVRTP